MRKELVIESLPVREIAHSRSRIREVGDLTALAQSIRENGVIVPLEVFMASEGHWELVHGHRRLEAAKQAGMRHVPCILIEQEEKVYMMRGILENLHRQDLKPVEEAQAIANLMSLTGQNVLDLERQGFGSETHLRDLLRLLEQPEDIQGLIGMGDTKARTEPLSLAHVKAAIGPYQAPILHKAAREGLTRAQTRQVTLAVNEAADEKRAEYLISGTAYDTLLHDPAHEKKRTERLAARTVSGTGAEPAETGADQEPQGPAAWVAKVTGILDSWTARMPELVTMTKPALENSPEDVALQDSLTRLREALRTLYDTAVPALGR